MGRAVGQEKDQVGEGRRRDPMEPGLAQGDVPQCGGDDREAAVYGNRRAIDIEGDPHEEMQRGRRPAGRAPDEGQRREVVQTEGQHGETDEIRKSPRLEQAENAGKAEQDVAGHLHGQGPEGTVHARPRQGLEKPRKTVVHRKQGRDVPQVIPGARAGEIGRGVEGRQEGPQQKDREQHTQGEGRVDSQHPGHGVVANAAALETRGDQKAADDEETAHGDFTNPGRALEKVTQRIELPVPGHGKAVTEEHHPGEQDSQRREVVPAIAVEGIEKGRRWHAFYAAWSATRARAGMSARSVSSARAASK